MDFKIGQKVSYPNHGVCSIESFEEKQVSGLAVEFYTLRVLSNTKTEIETLLEWGNESN